MSKCSNMAASCFTFGCCPIARAATAKSSAHTRPIPFLSSSLKDSRSSSSLSGSSCSSPRNSSASSTVGMLSFSTSCIILLSAAHVWIAARSLRCAFHLLSRCCISGIAPLGSVSVPRHLSHSCSRACLHVSLLCTSTHSIPLTRLFASSDTPDHPESGKSNSPFLILSNFIITVFWEKGGNPHRRMYKITPALHTSHSVP
mmetsp:Transcript_16359/g.39907  ORF Transcript_16359/g.39907 Transcript_16359/m.39907 type:complete len:201 (+) Transcript_16359:117-719(+)